MKTVEKAEPGLRERKRLATRRAIQLAVLDRVGERGLDGVTVDEISRVADVSPRTFFNYFSSKEEAVLGDAPELPSEGRYLEEFLADDRPLLDSLRTLLMVAGEKSLHDVEMVHRRQAILRQYPQLFAMRMATMRKFEDEMADVVAQRLVRDYPELAGDPDALADRARLVTLVAFAAMRHAWTRWAGGEPASLLSERLNESFRDLKVIFATDA